MNKKIMIDANKELGFNFPFMLIIPENIKDNTDLVVACTLPHLYTENSNSFLEMQEKTCKDFSSIDPVHIHLSLESGNPLFIPFIPKIRIVRPGFLGKKLYHNDFSRIFGKIEAGQTCFTKEDVEKYTDLSEQFNKMIKYGLEYLQKENINVSNKVIISGYSEGAKFASHFALLHPETIQSVVAGGTGGCISMPISHLAGFELNFPTGINDLENFNMDEFKKINFFYYMGDKDKSDSAIPYFETAYYMENGEKKPIVDECGNETPVQDENGHIKYILDENGNYQAKYSDCFDDEEVNIINKSLGTVTQERFVKQESIYNDIGLNAKFIIYPGNHRTIFDNKDTLFNDIDKFLESNTKQR